MPSLSRVAKIARGVVVGTAILIIGLVAAFAIRVEEWRTGDQGLSPLQYAPGQAQAGSRRLWIDTDAACGFSDRTDPDDCFAIALLGHQTDLHIIGISKIVLRGRES
jgi:hypothetical protein